MQRVRTAIAVCMGGRRAAGGTQLWRAQPIAPIVPSSVQPGSNPGELEGAPEWPLYGWGTLLFWRQQAKVMLLLLTTSFPFCSFFS